MDKTKIKKGGRPKKPDYSKASRGITVYFTAADYQKIKSQAEALRYKSISRFIKEKALAKLRIDNEIQRSIDTEKEAYKSYAASFLNDADELLILCQNFNLPNEISKTAMRLHKVAGQFEKRLTD